MNYRPEIDGLRAIAVAAVILFHAGFSVFSGGFIGVDVFFVISGFLITTIIVDDLQKGSFSLLRFYERRARRILPALFVVMAACIPFAYRLLSPDDLKDFSQSLAAISLFASNILFWGESGYFDTQADLKPLLHTWSLAVEEQFYVVFPLMLLAAWRLGTRRLTAMMILIAVLASGSLFLAVGEVSRFPSAAFYLLPGRAWELLVGALAAFVADRRHGLRNIGGGSPLFGEVVSIAGLSMILYCVFGYDEQTPFPGLNAVAPALGTALLLLFATRATWTGRMLAWEPLVGLGLISYSAYLWHQPLFAFTRHALLSEIPPALAVVLCVATVTLASLSWRYVEQPLRDRSLISRGGVFAFSVAGILLFVGLGAVGHRMSDRITAIRLASVNPLLRTHIRTRDSLVAERNTVVAEWAASAGEPFAGGAGTRKVLILGDSVSEDLYAAVMVNTPLFPGVEFRRLPLDEPCMGDFAQLVATGELPSQIDELTCRKSLEQLRDGSLYGEADVIVLCSNWPRYITHSTHEGAMALAETLATQGRDVSIVGLMSMQEASSTAFVAVKRGLSVEQANEIAYGTIQRSKIEKPNADARSLASRFDNVRYLDKYAVFSDDAARRTLLYDTDGQMLFADNFHLTRAGGLYFGRQMAAQHWFDGEVRAPRRERP
jgi:peptidoglycan/LPS O-acetylase OafA/YrhL